MMRPRLGHIQFLNCLPLYYGMVKNDVLLDVDLVKANPADLVGELLEGRLDIAPIPAIEYARQAEHFLLLPDIAISSDGEVQSILLISKVPVGELSARTIALTNTSRTSQVLLRILVKKYWKVAPVYSEMPPNLPAMLRDADAALLIGDEALRVFWGQHRELFVYDLGAEWTKWTGLPMVYAVWAVRRSFADEQPHATQMVIDALNRSIAYCRAHLGEISEYAARWESFDAHQFLSYFEALQFRFNLRYRDGFSRYLAEALLIGQLERSPSIGFFSNTQEMIQ